MVVFNLKLNAFDLTHKEKDTQELLSNLCAMIFDPHKYDKLNEKVFSWLVEQMDNYFNELNIEPYFNLSIKKTYEAIKNLQPYSLPLEDNTVLFDSFYQTKIIDEQTNKFICSIILNGTCECDIKGNITVCTINVLIQEKE